MTGRMLPPSSGPRPVGVSEWQPSRWLNLRNTLCLWIASSALIATITYALATR